MAESVEVGLQRERTALSWTRTALALIANGLLVLVRHEQSFPLPVAVALSVPWVLLALCTAVYAAQRSGVGGNAAADDVAPSRVVVPLGISVGVLCTATALAIVLT